MSKCRCGACRKWFSGATVFDMHRTGEYERSIYEVTPEGKQTKKVVDKQPCTRRCMTEAEMLAIGMKQDERGTWTSGKERPQYWADKADQDQPAAEEEGIA